MNENLRLARPYLLLLAIVTLGRWLLGTTFHVPYEKGTDKFSIVTITLFASIFYTAFCRRWRGHKILQAIGLAMTLGFLSQSVVLLATLASYAAGVDTYFNHPTALNATAAIGVGEALGRRMGGLVVNTIINGIAGALGWAVGGLLPETK